jgi:hypothetical protein
MWNFKKNIYKNSRKDLIPFDIEVSSLCSLEGATVKIQVVLGTGVSPYSIAPTTFSSEALALANTYWLPGATNITIGVDPLIHTTYWLVAKDNAGTVIAKSVYVNCPSCVLAGTAIKIE